jgi:hypothetical protein
MTEELAKKIAEIIANSARVVLRQHNIRDDAGDLSREIGNNAAQTVVTMIELGGLVGCRLRANRPQKDWDSCPYPVHSDDCDCHGAAGDR